MFVCDILCLPNCLEDLLFPNINNTKGLEDLVNFVFHNRQCSSLMNYRLDWSTPTGCSELDEVCLAEHAWMALTAPCY